MATVRSICVDALIEIGVIGSAVELQPKDAELALLRFQNQIDAWQADRLTLSVQGQTPITWPSSTSTQTVGPGGNINIQRPVWINTINYVNPGSSPAVEVIMGPMDQNSYASQSIKALQSGLPQEFFYQTSTDTALGSLFLWPQPTQQMTLQLYAPKGVTVPTTLDDVLLGPPGYQEAFMYQLALRLLTPFSKQVSAIPLLPKMADDAYARMKRPNNMPGLLGVDAALIPTTGGGYDIYTDTTRGSY